MFDALCSTSTEVNRLDLLNHDEPSQAALFRNRHMKWKTAFRVRYRTNNGQASTLVEQVLAHNQSRPTTLLFVTGLGIESDGDNVTLLGDIGRHLPCLFADRLSPVDFAGTSIFGNLCHKVLKAVPPSDLHGWSYDDTAVSHLNIHLIPDSKSGVF